VLAAPQEMSELRGPSPPMAPPGMPPQQPPMQINPAFQQWMQQKQAWDAETQSRQKQFMAACQLISDDAAQSFKIDIEADSTVAADEQEEKKSRTEFLQVMTPFLEAMIPIAQGNPALMPLVSELILFGVRAFPTSRQLEDAFETALQKMAQMPPAPPPQQGGKSKSPMEIQAEAQTAAGQQKVDMAETMAKAQSEQQSTAAKVQTDQQANAIKLQQIQSQMQIEREKMAVQQDKDATEMAMRGREMEGRENMEQAKIQHMQSRELTGLV
jgi:hypothetical protein